MCTLTSPTVYVWRPRTAGVPLPAGHSGFLARLTELSSDRKFDFGHAALGLPSGTYISFYPHEEAKRQGIQNPLDDLLCHWSPSLSADEKLLKRPPDDRIGITHLHIGAVETRVEELHDEKYCAFAYNCSSVVADCLEHGANGWEDEGFFEAMWYAWRQARVGFKLGTWRRMGSPILRAGLASVAAQKLTGRERFYSGLTPGDIQPLAHVYSEMLED